MNDVVTATVYGNTYLAVVTERRESRILIRRWKADEQRWIGDSVKSEAAIGPADTEHPELARATAALATQTGSTVAAITNEYGYGARAARRGLDTDY